MLLIFIVMVVGLAFAATIIGLIFWLAKPRQSREQNPNVPPVIR
jgi:hypothetical protein